MGLLNQNPLWQSLNAKSAPTAVASAYRQWSDPIGGDTQANKEAALGYLRGVGVTDSTIEQAREMFDYQTTRKRPTIPAPPAPAPTSTGTGLLANSLTANSTPQQVSDAYRQWSDPLGGDTQANKEAALSYLRNLGVTDNTMTQARGLYESPAPTPEPTPTPTPDPTPTQFHQTLSPDSRPLDVAMAYKQFLDQNGGETQANKEAALEYLRNLGIPDSQINQAHQLYLRMNDRNDPDFNRQVTNDELVEQRVARLLESGHPLLEQVRQRTLEQFASRGLLNTSMAAQAAQEAVLTKAIEIASQDANTANRQGMANQAFQNEFAGREQIQDFTIDNQYQDFLHRGDLMERELNLRNDLQADASVRDGLQTSRQRYQETLSQYQRDYQNQYQRLVEMEGVDAGTKNRMLDDLNLRYKATYDSTNAIYSKVPDWKNEWLSVFG